VEGRLVYLGIGGASQRRNQVDHMLWVASTGGSVLTRAKGAISKYPFDGYSGVCFHTLDGGHEMCPIAAGLLRSINNC
jgi:hypothetical protein